MSTRSSSSSATGWYIVAALFLIAGVAQILSLIISQADNREPDVVVDSAIELKSDLTIRFVDDVCYGIYATEKDRGMNSTIWVCDSGYIGYDASGTVFPDPNAPIPSNFNGE